MIPYYAIAILSCMTAFMAGGLITSGIAFASQQKINSFLIKQDLDVLTNIRMQDL